MRTGAELAAAIVEGYNRRDLQRVSASYAADARVHPDGWDQVVDIATWLDAFELILTSFPDLAFTTEHLATGNGVVIMELRLVGTNSGPFHLGDVDRLVLGTDAERLPPTGRAIDIAGTVVLETAGGMVTDERHYWKLFDTLRQLGLVENAPLARA